MTAETRLPVPREARRHLVPTRLDRGWLARRAARLDPRRHPSVSPSARVSHLLQGAQSAGSPPMGTNWRVIAALGRPARPADGEAPEADTGVGSNGARVATNGSAAPGVEAIPSPTVLRPLHERRRGDGPAPRSMAAQHQFTPERSVRTAELLAALSGALDLAEGHENGHAVRTCFVAMRLADALQLPHRPRADVFYAALLKDAGSSTNASEMAAMLGSSDLDQKRELLLLDTERPLGSLRFAAQHAGDAAAFEKVRRIAGLALRDGRARKRFMALRADGGAGIARELGFSDSVCEAIIALRERWDGHGQPAGLTGGEIPQAARVVALAEAAVTLAARDGEKLAEKALRSRRRHWYDPELVDLFLGMAKLGLWRELDSPDLLSRTMALESEHRVRMSNATDVDWVAVTFSQVVDAKSPLSPKHSRRVGDLAGLMALHLGLDEPLLSDVRRAGLLHDLGKLGVPNTVLDKTAPLDAEERALLAAHSALGAQALARVELLAVPAELIARHHDALDGSGFGGLDPRLAIPARILAIADLFDSLTAERPYPHPVPRAKALEMLRATTGDRYVPEVVRALESVL